MIEVKNLSFSYGQKKILDQVSFQLDSGEFMAVLGVNGVGKSTLITCMNRIHKPQNGVVLMNGQNVLSLSNHEAAKRMAYVSQFSEISRLTVFDTVLLGRKPYMKWSVSADDMELCNQILERLGIGDWKLRYMDELSGGEDVYKRQGVNHLPSYTTWASLSPISFLTSMVARSRTSSSNCL